MTLSQAHRYALEVLRDDLAQVRKVRAAGCPPSNELARWDRASARRQVRYVRKLRGEIAKRGGGDRVTMEDVEA